MTKIHWAYLDHADRAERDPLLVRLGERIRRLRKARKWARVHLARRLGVHPGRLAHWERGENQPPLAMLLALCRSLEVSLEELVGSSLPGELRNRPSGANSGPEFSQGDVR